MRSRVNLRYLPKIHLTKPRHPCDISYVDEYERELRLEDEELKATFREYYHMTQQYDNCDCDECRLLDLFCFETIDETDMKTYWDGKRDEYERDKRERLLAYQLQFLEMIF